MASLITELYAGLASYTSETFIMKSMLFYILNLGSLGSTLRFVLDLLINVRQGYFLNF